MEWEQAAVYRLLEHIHCSWTARPLGGRGPWHTAWRARTISPAIH